MESREQREGKVIWSSDQIYTMWARQKAWVEVVETQEGFSVWARLEDPERYADEVVKPMTGHADPLHDMPTALSYPTEEAALKRARYLFQAIGEWPVVKD